MKILVLEDDPGRTYRFAMMFVGHEIYITPDADIAIKHLATKKWDIVFLDHDLGGNQFVDSFADEKTGYTVARVMGKTVNRNTPTVIHSWNISGANNMFAVLNRPNVYKLPFGQFDRNILNLV